MKTATFVNRCGGSWTGEARLYQLSEPIKYGDNEEGANETRFVVVSATVAMFSGPETYIFPSDENGNALDWGELPGSYRGGMSHEIALKQAGFKIITRRKRGDK